MRKIAIDAVRAIKANKEYRRDNTRVYWDAGICYVRLYNTDIIVLDANALWLNSGGYWTVTTKSRINDVLTGLGFPISVIQKDFDWYITNGNDESVVDFYDGIELPYGLSHIDTPVWVSNVYGL